METIYHLIKIYTFDTITYTEMSSSDEITQNDAKFIHDNVTRDAELTRQLDEVYKEGEIGKIMAIYSLRRTGFQQASELIGKIPLSIEAKMFINQMKADMEMQFKIFLLENSMKEQFAFMTTKIDSLEAELKKLKEFHSE
jgi:hypothetical protein